MARLSWTHYTFGDGSGRLIGAAEPPEVGLWQPEPWTERAACVNDNPKEPGKPEDLNDWHQPANSPRTRFALSVCATCPVRQECLDYAIRNRIDNGIWGGVTEKELRSLLLKAYKQARAKTLVVIRPKRSGRRKAS
jgi:hypothetical protein